MSRPQFTESAWGEYLYWQSMDKKNLKKINKLIADIMRNGALEGDIVEIHSGIGHYEE